ncbi:restriction endonuclease subunit S [Streptomyces sp. NBC_00882]|uniref:restriction endonuclease subunit S n=1 Tax=Streptomyces TaxID=1883 RepID=UPI00386C8AB1|nr:restriction endonuclease subunit S [Streptomyces sp. NBC_00882]WSZ64126.1 restriction endonuclease subunit S [Streptomyces canus]
MELGELPGSWSWVPLKDLLSEPLINGRSVKTMEGGFPVLRLTAIKRGKVDLAESKQGQWGAEEAEPFLVTPGDFLLSRGNGSKHLVGRGGLVGDSVIPIAFPDTMIRVRPDRRLISVAYLCLLWDSPVVRRQIEDRVRTTAGIYKVNQAILERVSLPLPPLAEQQHIVEVLEEQLSRLDQGTVSVSAAQVRAGSLTETLVERAVRGLVGEPERLGAGVPLAEIRAATRARSDKRWKPTVPIQLPNMEVPEGWTLASLGDLAWGSGYGTSTKCDYGGAGKAVLRIPNVQHGFIDVGDMKYALSADVDLSEYFVKEGDILFVRTNGSPSLIGRAGVVERDMERAFASYLIRFRMNAEFVDPWWVQLVTRSRVWRRHIERIAASSAGQYNLNVKRLAELPIPLPNLSAQREILERLNSELSWIGRLQSISDTVVRRSERLRARVLAEAFCGRLTGQDPADEPASTILTRVAAERVTQSKAKSPRKVTAKRAAVPQAAAPADPAPEPTPAPALAVQQEFDL